MEARRVSKRTILYAEPYLIAMAAQDYSDYDKHLRKAEEIFGPMAFPVIDSLIMPPSFPYGGMENLGINMNASFIVTGDKANMDVAIHEFIHSWFGNLVTNARLEDFWLNEGLDMYAQRVVMEEVFGEALTVMDVIDRRAKMMAILEDPSAGRQACLATKVHEENPDDHVTLIPYEKGYLFGEWLEGKFGRASYLRFLRKYLETNRFSNVTTADFLAALEREFP